MTPAAARSSLAVFSLTLFLSAACMFALQPMAGKMLLPLVGGTPAGWVVAMAFFQIMLLAGYFLAHLFSRFTPRVHALLYIVALGAGMYFLPVDLAKHAALVGSKPGPASVFMLLTAALAVPFIALSATSSTIQRLFMTTGHGAAKDPYFLYAASNLGSFAGLLLYPLAIEPLLKVSVQTQGWTWAYASLAALTVLCLLLSGVKTEKKITAVAAPIPWKRRAEWLLLAFFPSSLLLGVTSIIVTDVISAPMVWVMPLAIYLLAFVAAFSRKQPVTAETTERFAPYAIGIGIVCCLFQPPVMSLGVAGMIGHLAAFAGAVLFCNMRLVALRPSAAAHLTDFYLMLSVGGALGGVLNAFVAPNIFNSVVEYPLCLLALGLLLPGNGPSTKNGRIVIALLALSCVVANVHPPRTGLSPELAHDILFFGNITLAILAFVLADSCRRYFLPGLAIILVICQFVLPRDKLLYKTRNFFGTIRVSESTAPNGEAMKYLIHGTTLHGLQVVAPPHDTDPATTYYYSLARVFETYKPKKVAVLGLGIGTLNCFSSPARAFTFFEIDPAMVEAAENKFTYLSKCKSGAPHRILLGDGRLELAKLADEKFDLIVLDVFSSDAIPTHLLTTEAMQLYASHLGPRGIVALHISNRYFDLQKIIAPTAAAGGLKTMSYSPPPDKEKNPQSMQSEWVIAAAPGTDLRAMKKFSAVDLVPRAGDRPWTDDHTNLLAALKFR